jgi:hypothetical protein
VPPFIGGSDRWHLPGVKPPIGRRPPLAAGPRGNPRFPPWALGRRPLLMGCHMVADNPQKQGITLAPLIVEV